LDISAAIQKILFFVLYVVWRGIGIIYKKNNFFFGGRGGERKIDIIYKKLFFFLYKAWEYTTFTKNNDFLEIRGGAMEKGIDHLLQKIMILIL